MSSIPFDVPPDCLRAESAALRGLSRALVGQEQDAEDVQQETWLAALQHPPAGSDERSAWLARVARNFAMRMRRKDAARRRWEREAARAESMPSTLEAVERVALHQQVVKVVLSLDEPYRTTIVLRFLEDRPPRDVACQMGVPVSTVRTRLCRALAILRDRLDHTFGSRSAWSGILPFGAEFGAVAGTTTVPSASLVLAGALLMTTKIKLAAVAIGALALFWLSWIVFKGPGETYHPAGTGEQDQTIVDPRVTPKSHTPMPAQREEVNSAGAITPTKNEVGQPPVLVDPYQVRIHVVDAAGNSVSGGTIAVWEVERKRAPDSLRIGGSTGERQGSEPILHRVTDQTGHCTVELNHDMVFLHAFKKGIGESDDWLCGPRTAKKGELVIALTPGVRLRGLVLRANGMPAANVDVHLKSSVARFQTWVRNPKPTKSNWEGRFEVTLRPGTAYNVLAREGKKRAKATVLTEAPGDKEVILRFAGALSIRGLLLDPKSRPVAGGRVRLWETKDPQRRVLDLLITATKTKSDGSFQIDVERRGRYRILGTKKGHANSELTTVEVTEVRPHADTIVRLLQPTSIAGLVRHQNGEPIKGVRLFLAAEQGEDPMWADRPTRHDLFARAAPVTTEEDGSFLFPGLHPKATYTLTCCPDPKRINIRIRKKGIEPGRQDVVMVLTEAAIRGSSITGTMVAEGTGDPVTDFRIEFVHYRDDRTVRGTSEASSAVIESGRYTLPGLSLGATYSFVVLSKNYAPMLVGPIHTTRESHAVDVRLKQLGGIECRVVDKQGKAMVNTKVALRPTVLVPGAGHRLPVPPKADGTLRLSKLAPGDYEICVFRNGQKLKGKKVEVTPGKTTQVELRIPR